MLQSWLGLRRRLLLATLSVVLVSVATGSALWNSDTPARPLPAVDPVRRGALELSPLPGWTRSASMPAIPGIPYRAPIVLRDRRAQMRLIAEVVPVSSPTLLPREFLRGLDSRPDRPITTRLSDGISAYYYSRLAVTDLDVPIDVYVIPTTLGAATLACVPARAAAAPYDECWRNVARLRIPGARAVNVGPDAALRQRLPAALGELNDVRAQERAALGGRVPGEQAAAAGRIAAAYEAAVTTLAPVTSRESVRGQRLLRQLSRVASGYRGVVDPLRNADSAAYARAGAAVRARERRLERLLGEPMAR